MSDSFLTHFGASMLTGLATTTVTAPVDLIKTRMFMSGQHLFTASAALHSSPAVSCGLIAHEAH